MERTPLSFSLQCSREKIRHDVRFSNDTVFTLTLLKILVCKDFIKLREFNCITKTVEKLCTEVQYVKTELPSFMG